MALLKANDVVEVGASINRWGGAGHVDASAEGALQTALGAAVVVVTNWVGDGDAWWAGETLASLVDMCGGLCW